MYLHIIYIFIYSDYEPSCVGTLCSRSRTRRGLALLDQTYPCSRIGRSHQKLPTQKRSTLQILSLRTSHH